MRKSGSKDHNNASWKSCPQTKRWNWKAIDSIFIGSLGDICIPLDKDIWFRPDVVDEQAHKAGLELQAAVGVAVQVEGSLPSREPRQAVVHVPHGRAKNLVNIGEQAES